MPIEKENAPTLESKRVSVSEHGSSLPLWDWKAQLALIVPLAAFMAAVFVGETL